MEELEKLHEQLQRSEANLLETIEAFGSVCYSLRGLELAMNLQQALVDEIRLKIHIKETDLFMKHTYTL